MDRVDDTSCYDFQAPVVCGGCESYKNVESFCLNCDANLCDSCKTHLIHRKHTVLPRTHSRVVATRMSMKRPCKQHPEESYATFCNTCQKPCCPKCIAENHDKHSFSQLEEAAKDVRGKFEQYAAKLDNAALGNMKKMRDTLEQRLAKTKSDADGHIEIVRQKCQSLRKSIDNMETCLLAQIDKMLKEDTEQLEKQLADIKSNEQRIRLQLASCHDVMTNANDVQLLISYHDSPNVTSFDAPKTAFLGEVEFTASTKELPAADDIIGVIQRKSTADVKQKPLLRRIASVEDMAKMMKKGTRVMRGRDWRSGNSVIISFHV